MAAIISVSSAESIEADYLDFIVTLSEPAVGPVTVQYQTVADGSGVSGVSYSNIIRTLTIADGESSATIRVYAANDRLDDFDENFTLVLTDPTNAELAGGGPQLQATGVILDNEGGPDRALFVSDPVIYEGTGGTQQALFEVRLSEPFSNTTTLSYQTRDGSALAGQDYTAKSGSVSFAPGQTVATVAVDINPDSTREGSEYFSLVVTPNSEIANGTDDNVGVAQLIEDDATKPGVPVMSVTSSESIEADYQAFVVTLSEPARGPVTVQYQTVGDGSAISGVSYSDLIGTLTIPEGETSATIRVYSSNERVNDFDENFTLVLTDPTNAVLAGGGPQLQATGVILDNEGGPDRALFVSDPVIYEGTGGTQQALFEVRLSEPFSNTTMLNYQTRDGSALAGEDYTAKSGSVSFAPGQTVATVAVDVTTDSLREGSEYFSLVVTPNGDIANGHDDNVGMAQIVEDDSTRPGVPVMTLSPAESIEADYLNFVVTLSEPAAGPVTVQYQTVADGSAVSGVSFSNVARTLTIPQGETSATIRIYAANERVNDFDENFTLVLTDPTNAVLAGGEPQLQATGVILDNDGGPDRALFVSDPVIFEGTSGTQQAVFEVRVSEAFDTTTTLTYETINGTATAGQDYVAKSGFLSFAPGQTVASVAVDIVTDTRNEGSETFSLAVNPTSDIANGVADNVGEATIVNDDRAYTVRGGSGSGNVLVGGPSADLLRGFGGNDVLRGRGGNDILDGSWANDILVGGAGSDTSIGGFGNDSIFAGSDDDAGDSVLGGAGNDIIGGGPGNDTLHGGNGRDSVFGGEGNDILDDASTDTDGNFAFGGAGTDLVIGGRGADTIGGGTGNDTILGLGGNDQLYGGATSGGGDDSLDGGAGNDTVFGGAGVDTVEGGAGNDLVYNGAANDFAFGGSGADTLYGGGGNDILIGEDGADVFAFVAGNGVDIVADFETGTDKIDLSDDSMGLGNFSQVSAAATQVGDDLYIAQNFANRTTIILENMTLGDLSASDFIFS